MAMAIISYHFKFFLCWAITQEVFGWKYNLGSGYRNAMDGKHKP